MENLIRNIQIYLQLGRWLKNLVKKSEKIMNLFIKATRNYEETNNKVTKTARVAVFEAGQAQTAALIN